MHSTGMCARTIACVVGTYSARFVFPPSGNLPGERLPAIRSEISPAPMKAEVEARSAARKRVAARSIRVAVSPRPAFENQGCPASRRSEPLGSIFIRRESGPHELRGEFCRAWRRDARVSDA
jgi:hypothetical protein